MRQKGATLPASRGKLQTVSHKKSMGSKFLQDIFSPVFRNFFSLAHTPLNATLSKSYDVSNTSEVGLHVLKNGSHKNSHFRVVMAPGHGIDAVLTVFKSTSRGGGGGALPYKPIQAVPFVRVSFFSINS